MNSAKTLESFELLLVQLGLSAGLELQCLSSADISLQASSSSPAAQNGVVCSNQLPTWHFYIPFSILVHGIMKLAARAADCEMSPKALE